MSAFPKLPTLERLKSSGIPKRLLARTGLVAVQHLLETTGSLFEALIDAGLPAHQIHVLGKAYSTNDRVARKLSELGIRVHETQQPFPWGGYDEHLRLAATAMWQSVADWACPPDIDRLVVLDDGGHATTTVPRELAGRLPIAGVEQTMSGLHGTDDTSLPIPVVAVASSAAKTIIEPLMIREAVFRRVAGLAGPLAKRSMGVIGAGNIGQAIVRGILENAQQVSVYDPEASRLPHDPRVRVCTTAGELLSRCEVLWGCSGADFFDGLELHQVAGATRTLISCSSSDREFRTLLHQLNDRAALDGVSRFADLDIACDGVRLDIRRGGFPINFDGSPESVPSSDIQMTRGLLFAGVMQACAYSADKTTVMLAPEAQRTVVDAWFATRSDRDGRLRPELVDQFADHEWIAQFSGGRRFAAVS